MVRGSLLYPVPTGANCDLLEERTFYALSGTYDIIALGTTLSGRTLPEGWEYALAVPYLSCYKVKSNWAEELAYDKEHAFMFGPPMEAFLGSYFAGTFFVDGIEYQQGVAKRGFPAVQNWQFLNGVRAVLLDLTAPSGIPAYVENPDFGFLAKFVPAVTFGSQVIEFFGKVYDPTERYRYDFPLAEETEDDLHFVRMFTSFKVECETEYLNHWAIISSSSETPIFWRDTFSGTFFLRAIGVKEYHVLSKAKYNVLKTSTESGGALIYPGWIACAGIVRVGSVKVTYHEQYSYFASLADFRFNPGSVVTQWWPVNAFVMGSILRRRYGLPLLAIQTGIILPYGFTVEFYTEKVAYSLWVATNIPSGSVLVHQACIGIPQAIRWYPQTQNFVGKTIEFLYDFLNKDSFVLLVDETDGPFIFHPQDDNNKVLLCNIMSFTPLGCTAEFVSEDRARFQLQYSPLEFLNLAETFYVNLNPMSDPYLSVPDRVRPLMYAHGLRMVPVWPADWNPWYLEDWSWRAGNFPLIVWDSSGISGFRFTHSFAWEPQFVCDFPEEDDIVDVIYPRARFYFETWSLHRYFLEWNSEEGRYERVYPPDSNVFIGTWVQPEGWHRPYFEWISRDLILEERNGSLIEVGIDNGALAFKLEAFGTLNLAPVTTALDFRDLRVWLRRWIEIAETASPYGGRYSVQIRIQRAVPLALLERIVPDVQLLNERRLGSQLAGGGFGMVPGYYTLPATYKFENQPEAFVAIYQMFPKQFLGEGVLAGSSPRVILGRTFIWVSAFLIGASRNLLRYGFDITPEHRIIVEPNRTYTFANVHYPEKFVKTVLYLLGLTRGLPVTYARNNWNFPIGDPEFIEVLLKNNSFYSHPGYLGYRVSSVVISPAIHPAPSPIISIGQLACCGTTFDFCSAYSLMPIESLEKFLSKNVLGTQVLLFGTMESIAIFKGQDPTIFNESLSELRKIEYYRSSDPRYREPALSGGMYFWNYDNPFNTQLPTKLLDPDDEFSRRMDYRAAPMPVATTFFGVANESIFGTVSWRTLSTSRFARLVFPYSGWIRSLPAGLLRRIPNPNEAIARTGTILALDNEVVLMRQIITMGNAVITVYPRHAVINGAFTVPYFTQDGGACPLWMGEPIVGVDAIPFDEGDVRIFVYSTMGVYSFNLAFNGVYDWTFEPIPTWFGSLLGG